MKWTEKQQQVIDTRNRNLLVSAAAGSGKTAVLVERIIQMISGGEHPLDLDQLLVMTFTNAAAAEMRERIAAAIEKKLMEQPENRSSSGAGGAGPSCADHHHRQLLSESDP